jgi:flagellar motor switch protein FliM
MFLGEKFGRDSIWETHLAEELWLTDIELKAVLDEQFMRLGDIFDFKVGSRIMLGATPDSLVNLRCGDVTMCTGQMGRRGSNIAVRVEERIMKQGT